jgi:hypothetical protein
MVPDLNEYSILYLVILYFELNTLKVERSLVGLRVEPIALMRERVNGEM